MNFFNVNMGYWEPFIERFGVKLMMNQEIIENKKNLQLTFNTPLRMNLTEKLFENLYESHTSWSEVAEKFDSFIS